MSKRNLLPLIYGVFIFFLLSTGYSFSYFNDNEHSMENTVSSGVWSNSNCTETDGCFEFTLVSVEENNGQTTLTVNLTVYCDHGLSYFAVSLPPGSVATTPEDGAVYISPNGEMYRVENPTNNPFYSIKFEWFDDDNDGGGVKGGLSDVFRFNVNTDDAGYYDLIRMQAKAGNILGMVSIDIACNAG